MCPKMEEALRPRNAVIVALLRIHPVGRTKGGAPWPPITWLSEVVLRCLEARNLVIGEHDRHLVPMPDSLDVDS